MELTPNMNTFIVLKSATTIDTHVIKGFWTYMNRFMYGNLHYISNYLLIIKVHTKFPQAIKKAQSLALYYAHAFSGYSVGMYAYNQIPFHVTNKLSWNAIVNCKWSKMIDFSRTQYWTLYSTYLHVDMNVAERMFADTPLLATPNCVCSICEYPKPSPLNIVHILNAYKFGEFSLFDYMDTRTATLTTCPYCVCLPSTSLDALMYNEYMHIYNTYAQLMLEVRLDDLHGHPNDETLKREIKLLQSYINLVDVPTANIGCDQHFVVGIDFDEELGSLNEPYKYMLILSQGKLMTKKTYCVTKIDNVKISKPMEHAILEFIACVAKLAPTQLLRCANLLIQFNDYLALLAENDNANNIQQQVKTIINNNSVPIAL